MVSICVQSQSSDIILGESELKSLSPVGYFIHSHFRTMQTHRLLSEGGIYNIALVFIMC